MIKCVVWDLDNTVWDGVLLEQDRLSLREQVVGVIKALDERGILHSIASRNEPAAALEQLREFQLAEYFLYPQINWNSKADSIRRVAELLNIGLDSIAFVDDQPFELEEVKFSIPELLCLGLSDVDGMLARPELSPANVTRDARARRLMYQSDIRRQQEEDEFVGPKEEFLATLGLRFNIAPAGADDLARAEELTLRTNQLNTTGYTYSRAELEAFSRSEGHRLLVAGLEDKYGDYGKIGLALLECGPDRWVIKLLLMSCRVMSRGAGTLLLNQIMRRAKEEGVRLLSEFVPNERNRMMHVSYKFAGFREVERRGNLLLLENDLTHVPPCPVYVELRSDF